MQKVKDGRIPKWLNKVGGDRFEAAIVVMAALAEIIKIDLSLSQNPDEGNSQTATNYPDNLKTVTTNDIIPMEVAIIIQTGCRRFSTEKKKWWEIILLVNTGQVQLNGNFSAKR